MTKGCAYRHHAVARSCRSPDLAWWAQAQWVQQFNLSHPTVPPGSAGAAGAGAERRVSTGARATGATCVTTGAGAAEAAGAAGAIKTICQNVNGP